MNTPSFENTKFHGDGYEAATDNKRLVGHLRKVFDVMIDHRRHTLAELSARTGVPEASVSACLRSLRNQHGYVILKERQIAGKGTWQYWIAGGGMGEAARTRRKMKPVGDPEKFGKMMQAMYARGAIMGGNYESQKDTVEALREAVGQWVNDMVLRIKSGKFDINNQA